MREIDFTYGSFEPSATKKDLNDEILAQNVEALNRHFEEKARRGDEDSASDIVDDNEQSNDLIQFEEGSQKVGRRKTSIGGKLIFLISTLVILSMGLITFLVSYFVTADTRANSESSNFTLNSRTSSDCENQINNIVSNVVLFYDLLDGISQPAISSDDEISEDDVLDFEENETENFNDKKSYLKNNSIKFFELNPEIAAIKFDSDIGLLVNKEFAISNGIKDSVFEAYFESEEDSFNRAKNGNMKIQNASPFFSNAMMAVFFPVFIDNHAQVISVLFSTERLAENISTGKVNESFLINDKGIVLLHNDSSKMMTAFDLSQNKFIREILDSNSTGMQQSYIDENGEEYFAACKRITNAGCYVVTQVKTSVVLAAIQATTKRNIALTIAILSIAILIIWIFAKTLSVPLKKLTAVTDEINNGNFNTDLFNKLNVKRTDEIGVLNRSTKNERDILNTVTSLTNRGVTKAIVKKEIDFQPHLKDITIFFSDIRGFTAISDGFNKRFGEKSAAEIIGFLNDYMSRMVNCISITGGNVDKFEGDAIMACWGVLRDDNLDFDKNLSNPEEYNRRRVVHKMHVEQDAVSAIKATVAMRYALMKYNKDAEIFTNKHAKEPLAKYKPHIRIGCGLNSGRATVGFMGSKEKMEFTSIGDAVNLASRTESSNKPCGTDILITQDTYDILCKNYIRCLENSYIISEENKPNEIIVEQIPVTFEVKGKGKQHFYGVVNMPNFDIEEFFRTNDPDFKADPDCAICVGPNGPKTLHEVRELLGIPTPDFESVNLDAEESKVKAQ